MASFDIDLPDKITGLSPRERREVTESWLVVKKDLRKNANELFCKFCAKHPEHHARFARFRAVPVRKLPACRTLQSHANSVMYALDAAVEHLADTSCLVNTMLQLGCDHVHRNVPEAGFKDLKVVFLGFLRDKLGSKLSEGGYKAWDKTFNVVYAVIFQGMQEERARIAV